MTHNRIASEEREEHSMAYRFPSEGYIKALMDELNNDERYAEVAKNWEGDIIFTVEPDKEVDSPGLPISIYMDLWHGECREVKLIDEESEGLPTPVFTLLGPRREFMAVLSGEVEAMQAMLTRSFLRVCRKVEIEPDSI
jgi:putative sterol carrier protein